MADEFTCFKKFGDACEALTEDDQNLIGMAIAVYGMFGREVELPYHLNAMFQLMKKDIDFSKTSRKNGARGGRPRKSKSVSKSEKPSVSENEKPPVSELEKPVVSENEKPHNSTVHNSTVHNSTYSSLGCAGEEFTPPTADEARAYFEANCLSGDPEEFVNHFAAQGWVRGNGIPVTDWHPLAMTWSSNERRREAERRAGPPGDEYERSVREMASKYADDSEVSLEDYLSGLGAGDAT